MTEIELLVGDEQDGVSSMGFVDFPAIEVDGIYFNKNKFNLTFGKSTGEEGLFVAPAMIADKRIYRYNPETNEEYYVWFSPETIKQVSQDFMINNYNFNNKEQHEKPIKDIHLVYSWLVYNDKDPIITHFGFKNIPVGSWICVYKINNPDIREKIKNGVIRGLSIEGYFAEK
ncbi:MAG: hypothetical protein KC589_09130, partial [Nanoarchaeota archaeon]|nr:hypothetical protein [Nanoarchaeota archaeon]